MENDQIQVPKVSYPLCDCVETSCMDIVENEISLNNFNADMGKHFAGKSEYSKQTVISLKRLMQYTEYCFPTVS
jgi:hypothetical protein